ncbi:hypothetical protein K503DRAFT_802459 [Rhizopogon vinicolor AM-OR11-026]|uniref:F-box domain-containing protein n=1 Tax=Rhizopogon vinicolor AM-OR11-026 TaxID=1314800 RepID=A0A1B7MTL7_9AGAM|nr:hypothetical protein K503DRAFT_802459 [Rhizopogon vinicolor AM-OR11-026]
MSSWPRIESLVLLDKHLYEPAVTFRELFAAISPCPHLHALRVSMTAANIDIDPKAASFQHPSLHTLNLGASFIRDAEAVALTISPILPHVSQATYEEHEGNSFRLEWGEVNDHLKL